MNNTRPRKVPGISEKDRWFSLVWRWFPKFLRGTDDSYLSKDGSKNLLERKRLFLPIHKDSSYLSKDGSNLYKDGFPEFLRETDEFCLSKNGTYLSEDGSQNF